MADERIAAMQAIIDGRDSHIATLEAEISILKRQVAEGIRARRVTVDEYLNYTEGLEYIHGRMQTKNGVEVLVPVEEDFQKIKDAIEMSIEKRLVVSS